MKQGPSRREKRKGEGWIGNLGVSRRFSLWHLDGRRVGFREQGIIGEAELVGYCEAMIIGDGLGAVLSPFEGLGCWEVAAWPRSTGTTWLWPAMAHAERDGSPWGRLICSWNATLPQGLSSH